MKFHNLKHLLLLYFFSCSIFQSFSIFGNCIHTSTVVCVLYSYCFFFIILFFYQIDEVLFINIFINLLPYFLIFLIIFILIDVN